MSKRPPPPVDKQRPEPLITPAVLTALIALLGTVIAACVSSPALVALIDSVRRPAPAPAAVSTPANELPTVRIEGAATAELNSRAYFTIVSSDAVRGVWSISGFQNEPVAVEPLGPSHQLYVEPTSAERVGDSFTLVVTVYDAAGASAGAQHSFQVVAP